jgi:hypothetical protein
LFGREYEFVVCRINWGEERAYYRDEHGEVILIPARWTSVIPPDPVVELSGGRSRFRAQDLLALVRLLEALRTEESRS